jgi:hypothetical protein
MTAQMVAVTQLLSRLETLNQDEHQRTRQAIFRVLCASDEALPSQLCGNFDNDVDGIIADIEMLDISEAAESRTRDTVQNSILKTLRYPSMSDRYEDIVEAHPETFEWAFHDSTAKQRKWSNIPEWLKIDSGIYWVSGKAGSGKSTFMKHVLDEGRTREYLKEWAKESPLFVATFFFWNSGTKE